MIALAADIIRKKRDVQTNTTADAAVILRQTYSRHVAPSTHYAAAYREYKSGDVGCFLF
jgi:hypothetical protein